MLYWYFASEDSSEVVEDEIMLFFRSGYDITQANLPEFLKVKNLYEAFWTETKVRSVLDVSEYKKKLTNSGSKLLRVTKGPFIQILKYL